MYDSDYDGDDEAEWAAGPLEHARDDDDGWWRPGRRFISEPPAREEEATEEEEEEMVTEDQGAVGGDGEDPDEFWRHCQRCEEMTWGSELEEMLEARWFVDDAVYAPFHDFMW